MDALERVEAELNEATERARRLLDATDGRLFTVRPDPGSWSAAECVAHLSLSTESFLPVLRDAIAAAKKRGAQKAKAREDLLGRILRWFLEPPIRSRVRTTAPFVPKAVRSKADAMLEFSTLQTRLLELVRDARGLDLRKPKIVSPFDSRVRYNVYSAFRILAAHQRRHLWQAEQAVQLLMSWRVD